MVLLPIPVVWLLLDHYGKLTFLEERSVDWRFRARGELESPVKLVYVDVDSLSQARIGNHPWTRDLYSKVANALIKEGGVKAVGFDFVFSDAGISQSADRTKIVQGNREFMNFLQPSPPVVLAAAYAGWHYYDINKQKRERHIRIVSDQSDKRKLEDVEPPEIPYFLVRNADGRYRFDSPGGNIGLIDTFHNGTRMVPAWAPCNAVGLVYYHMAVELARLYWGLPVNALRVREGRLEFVRENGSVHASLPLVDGQFLEVNWYNRWVAPAGAAPMPSRPSHVEFVDVLILAQYLETNDPKKVQVAKEFFADPGLRDAVVLIGPVDPLLQDLAPTSLDDEPVPKVGVHGNLLRTIVSGQLLRRPPPWALYAILGGMTLIIVVLSTMGAARTMWGTMGKELIILIVPVGLYVGLAFLVFRTGHWVLPFAAPLGTALTTGIGGLVLHLIDLQQAKSRITGMFGAYVSPQLVERMVDSGEDPKLGGHEEQITAYFSDIQNFSSFSEILPPDRLVELMNEYLTACTDIVQEQGGTLDKYIGDAVVAMYGAPIPLPDHAFRACLATQRVHLRLGELRQKWKAEGDKWPEIVWNMQSRIGLNSGSAIIGNMGSRTRFNYTMMGDNVNLAARMESGAKQYGVYTMVTEETKNACEQHEAGRLVFRYLEKIVVKGRSKAVPIYEVVGLTENVGPQALECVDVFGQAVARYLAQDWDGAEALFKRSAELEPNQPGRTPGVHGNPSLTLITRCHYMREHSPGTGWDGVYVMKEK